MSTSDLLPTLPKQVGIVYRPEFRRPVELCNEVSSYDAVCRPVCHLCLSWVGEVYTSLFDRQTGDCPPKDLGLVSLIEGWEKCVLQLILYRLNFHPFLRGDALHECPLLLEELLQASVCGLQVPTLHPIQGGHRVLSSHNLLPQPLCLR